MTTREAFGWICIVFFLLAAFFSIVLHNLWHAIAIFAIGGVGVFLIAKEWLSDIFGMW